MRGILLLVALSCALGVARAQRAPAADYDYFYDTTLDAAPQPVAPPRPPSRARTAAAAPLPSRPSADLEPRLQGSTTTTTPVPIVIDERRLDTKTGAFVYHYEGADGSMKHETRYPNGTVFGNFTFINDLGEPETRYYQAGALGTQIAGDSVGIVAPPTLVDETTDPTYVDLSQYEHYKHLERPYVHIAGPAGELPLPGQPRPSETAPSSAPRSRPAPRQQAARPPPAPTHAPEPLDFQAAGVFDYEDAAPPARAPQRAPAAQPSRSRARRPQATVVPSPPQFPGTRIVAGQVRSPARAPPRPAPAQPHRLAAPSAPSAGGNEEFLDALIRQFQPAQFSGK